MVVKPLLAAEVRAQLRAQLPAQLRDRFQIEVSGDPYFLRGMAIFHTGDGPTYPTEIEGLPEHARLPDAFLAWIALVAV